MDRSAPRDVRLDLACAAIVVGGRQADTVSLVLAAAPLAWQSALEKGETGIDLELRARLDQQPVSLTAHIFGGRGLQEPTDAMSVGLRRLRLNAAGVTAMVRSLPCSRLKKCLRWTASWVFA